MQIGWHLYIEFFIRFPTTHAPWPPAPAPLAALSVHRVFMWGGQQEAPYLRVQPPAPHPTPTWFLPPHPLHQFSPILFIFFLRTPTPKIKIFIPSPEHLTPAPCQFQFFIKIPTTPNLPPPPPPQPTNTHKHTHTFICERNRFSVFLPISRGWWECVEFWIIDLN